MVGALPETLARSECRAWFLVFRPDAVREYNHPPIADSNIREVCIMAASQVGKSEFATLNPILYLASVDPAPMLLICPTLQACRSMSLDRLDPMLRDSPIARPFVSEQIGGPGSDNSMFRKNFENGCQLAIVAGLSATGLSMRPVKYLFFEECSRLPLMAVGRTAEGDVIQLAKVRTSTFGSQAKIIYSSSPVEEQSCRITALFRDSTEEHYYSQCSRGHFQILGLPEMIFETGECMCLECSRSYDQATWLERGRVASTRPAPVPPRVSSELLCLAFYRLAHR